MSMGTYSYNGQFGQGLFNPQTGGGTNMTTGRLAPNWSNGLGGNAWLGELKNVMKNLGFNYGSLAGGGNKGGTTNGMPTNMWNFVGQATGGGGGTSLPINARLTDTTAAINAAKPAIYEEQTKGFGNAAKRFGQTGMLASQPYMEALGGVSRKSSNDIASLIENLNFQANESAAQRGLQADIATQSDQTARDIANRNRLMDAAGMVWDTSQGDNANNLAAAQLLGDWYMRMREGDENRTLSYAGMDQGQGQGGSARGPSYIPAPDTNASRINSYMQQMQEQSVRDQLSGKLSPVDALRKQLEMKDLGNQLNPATDPLDNLRRSLETRNLTGQLNQDTTGEDQMAAQLRKKQLAYDLENGPWAPAKGSTPNGLSPELFQWLRSMGFDDSVIKAIQMNPQMLENFLQKFGKRGV